MDDSVRQLIEQLTHALYRLRRAGEWIGERADDARLAAEAHAAGLEWLRQHPRLVAHEFVQLDPATPYPFLVCKWCRTRSDGAYAPHCRRDWPLTESVANTG